MLTAGAVPSQKARWSILAPAVVRYFTGH